MRTHVCVCVCVKLCEKAIARKPLPHELAGLRVRANVWRPARFTWPPLGSSSQAGPGWPPEISHSACLAEKRRGALLRIPLPIHTLGLSESLTQERTRISEETERGGRGRKKQQDQKEREEKHEGKKAAPRHPGAKPREGFRVCEAAADTTGPAAVVRKHLGRCEDLFF